MKVVKENEGIRLIKCKSKYYLEYDAGTHMIKKKESRFLLMKLKHVNMMMKKCIIQF